MPAAHLALAAIFQCQTLRCDKFYLFDTVYTPSGDPGFRVKPFTTDYAGDIEVIFFSFDKSAHHFLYDLIMLLIQS